MLEPRSGFLLGKLGKHFRGLGRRLSRLVLRRRIPLAYKMALAFSLVIILGMGVLGWAVIQLQDQLMRKQMNEFGVTIASQYAAGATDFVFTDKQFEIQVLTAKLVNDSLVEGAALFENDGDSLIQQGEVPLPSLDVILREGRTIDDQFRLWEWWGVADEQRRALASFLAPVSFKEVTAGYALVTVSQSNINRSFQRTLRTILAATVLMMAIAILMAYWMSRRMARPIERIVEATDALGRGDFQVRINDRRNDELGRLNEAVNRMAKNMQEKNQVEGVLTRLVSNEVAEEMLSDPAVVDLGSERVVASVLFVDIVGFTSKAEKLEPEAVVEMLNEYFSHFTQCSHLFFGAVDKFIGDCAMVIFGAPRANPNHRFNAIACAVVIMRLLERLNLQRQREGKESVEVRIGINTGEMMAGMIGARERMEYTVVGDAVNLASRISALAGPGEIVVGEEVLHQPNLKDRVTAEPFRQVKVKGKSVMVSTYRIVTVAAKYQSIMDNMIDDILNAGAYR